MNDWTLVTFLGFNHRLLKCTFLCLEEETVLPEDIKDPYHNHMMLFFGLATENEYVIHVDSHNSLVYEFLEDVIHNHMKAHWTVCEAEEHDQGFKQALVHLEGGFPLLSFPDLHIVVSPAEV